MKQPAVVRFLASRPTGEISQGAAAASLCSLWWVVMMLWTEGELGAGEERDEEAKGVLVVLLSLSLGLSAKEWTANASADGLDDTQTATMKTTSSRIKRTDNQGQRKASWKASWRRRMRSRRQRKAS
eukprot:2704442-Rhodomonas_salina.1